MIKSLPEQFRKSDVIYQLVKRSGDYAIYSLQYPSGPYIIGYDCVTVQSYQPDYERGIITYTDSQKYEQIETYPTGEMFGPCSWSFSTLPSAEAKYQELIGEK